MSTEPLDEEVRNKIISTVGAMQAHMRPNKLRKIICKQVSGTDWSQYQRVVDDLIKIGSLETEEVDGETMILPSKYHAASVPPKQDKVKVIAEDLDIPFGIILYLTKKGRKKQKNIEMNTKTELTFDTDTKKALKNNTSNVEKATLTITKSFSSNGSTEGEEAKEAAMKQMKAAKFHILQMLKSLR